MSNKVFIDNIKKEKHIYIESIQDLEFAKKNNISNIIFSDRDDDFKYKYADINIVEDYADYIKDISIIFYKYIDYSAIHYLNKLKYISIELLALDNQKIDFQCFPQLENLTFNWRKKTLNIDKLLNLKELLTNKYKKENLLELSNLTKLETLFVWQSSIESLEGIESLVNLQRLSLFKNKKLRSLQGLENLRNLTELEIDECKSLESIEEVKQLKNLKTLKVENSGVVADTLR